MLRKIPVLTLLTLHLSTTNLQAAPDTAIIGGLSAGVALLLVTAFFLIRSIRNLRSAATLSQQTITTLPTRITVLDRQLHIVLSNHTGKNDTSPCAPDLAREVFATGKPGRRERTGPDGHIIELDLLPICDNTGHVTLVAEQARDITEHRQQQDRLRQKEELYRSMVETQTDAICRWRPDGTLTFANRTYRDMFGITDDTAGQNWIQFLPQEIRPAMQKIVDDLARNPRVHTQEHEVVNAQGQIHWQQWTNSPLFDRDGGLLEFQSVGHDITERRKIEENLRHSEERYRNLVENQTEAVCRWLPDTTITFANRAYCNFFGISDEAAGQKWIDFLPPAIHEEIIRASNDLARHPRINTYEHPVINATGETCWQQWVDSPIFDPQGQLVEFQSVGRDITKRKLAEEDRTRLVTAIEQSAETILITDAEGTIEYVNPAFTRLSGYTREEALGKNPRLIKSGKHDDAFYRELWETISAGRTWNGHLINRHKDGSLYTEDATISPVYAANGTICNYVGVKRDISKEIALEQQLRQSQKMEAIGTLAGGIAHDFNNLLSIVLGFTNLALHHAEDAEAVTGHLTEVLKAGTRAKDLVTQILTFSRQTEQNRLPLRLQDIITEAANLLRGTIPSTVDIRVTVDHECDPVFADPGQMHQVIMNLCTNAYQAMRDYAYAPEQSGRDCVIEVTLDEMDIGQADLFPLPNLASVPYARLTVSDTGEGMDAATMERIFEPYFTTKDKSQGSGLGLAMVQGIVQTHDGLVTVDSTPDKGSVFTVYLPIHNQVYPAGEEHHTRNETISPPPGGSEHILLVDDEEQIVEMGQMTLEMLGYRVSTATDPLDALKRFRDAPETFDLVVSDMTMPHMTGIELIRHLLNIRPDLPVILCSGFSEEMSETRAREEGIRAYVMKPIMPADFARLIRATLDNPPPT